LLGVDDELTRRRGETHNPWAFTGILLMAAVAVFGGLLSSFYHRPPQPGPGLVVWFVVPAAIGALLGLVLFLVGRVNHA
jgi:hypothetical protein